MTKEAITFTTEEIEKFEALIEGDYDGPRVLSEREVVKFEAFVIQFGTDSLKRSMVKVTWDDAATDDAGRPIIDGVPAIAAADFELLTADVLAEEDDETDAPIADEEEAGAVYHQAFARAEERVAARREIDRLRAVIDRAGALAAQNASAEMIRSALAEAAASSRVSSEILKEYRWDVGDPSCGPFGETESGKKV